MKPPVAIVSGGAGDIGSAISTRLASLGYSVVIAVYQPRMPNGLLQCSTLIRGNSTER